MPILAYDCTRAASRKGKVYTIPKAILGITNTRVTAYNIEHSDPQDGEFDTSPNTRYRASAKDSIHMGAFCFPSSPRLSVLLVLLRRENKIRRGLLSALRAPPP